MPATAPPHPTDAEIHAALGDNFGYWTEIIAATPAVPEWKYYGAKYGFSLKLMAKKRNLFFMNMHEGKIAIAFIFGEKACARALESDLDESLKQLLRDAPRYPEGRGVRLTVDSPEGVAQVKRLLEVKLAS